MVIADCRSGDLRETKIDNHGVECHRVETTVDRSDVGNNNDVSVNCFINLYASQLLEEGERFKTELEPFSSVKE